MNFFGHNRVVIFEFCIFFFLICTRKTFFMYDSSNELSLNGLFAGSVLVGINHSTVTDVGMAPRRKHVALTIEQKYDIIQKL